VVASQQTFDINHGRNFNSAWTYGMNTRIKTDNRLSDDYIPNIVDTIIISHVIKLWSRLQIPHVKQTLSLFFGI